MDLKLVFSHLILAFAIANVMAADKYDRKSNRVDRPDLDKMDKSSMMGREFKSRQVIQVWQKADRVSSSLVATATATPPLLLLWSYLLRFVLCLSLSI